jgi:predicted GNAT superfamily acetyltransferase
MTIRPLVAADFGAVLALNEESVHFLSPLSLRRLAHLHEQAALPVAVEWSGHVVGFLLAFREGADYDSVNYQWFSRRYDHFLYIDRVVVSSQTRSGGVGRNLYEHAFIYAARTGASLVTCEFDVQPLNLVSERFHAKFGFREVGRHVVADANKIVSLQAATVQATNAT